MLSVFWWCALAAGLFALFALRATMPYLFTDRSEMKRAIKRIHGPRGLPFIGVGLTLCRLQPDELMDFLTDICRQYPRLTKLWVAAVPNVIIQEPEDVEVILGSSQHIRKGIEYTPLLPWLQNGLLVSTGRKWHGRRKILTPTFHFRILEDGLGSINSNAKLFVCNLLKQEGKLLNIEEYITRCTMDVIGETAMGIKLNAQKDDSSEYVQAVKNVSHLAIERVIRFWLYNNILFNISKIGKEFQKNLKTLHNFTEKIINERKSAYVTENHNIIQEIDDGTGKKRTAFLDRMIEIDLQDPDALTHKGIKEEVDTFMFEGHDTTSAAILFSLYLLGHHFDVQDKVYEELWNIFGDSKRDATMRDVQEMKYLEKVIKETLRLYPSVPYLSRLITKSVELGDGITLPRGVNVIILPYLIHRNTRHFVDPEVFDPERFSQSASKRHPYAYIPFSAGPRNCIGQKFAMMELKILLSTVIRRAKVESITQPGEFKLRPHLILRPNKPIIVRVTSRDND